MGKQHPEHTKLHALPGRSCGTREGEAGRTPALFTRPRCERGCQERGDEASRGVGPLGINSKYGRASKKMDS